MTGRGWLSVLMLLTLTAACGDGGSGGSDDGGDDSPPAMPGSVTRVDAEPAGAPCPGGGSVVHVGIDDDGDGALDDDEIDDSSYLCSDQIWYGDFLAERWADPAAVAVVRRARSIVGNLELAAAISELPLLEVVTGDVRIVPGAGEVLLPRLMAVAGALLSVPAATPTRYELPALVSVGGWMVLNGSQAASVNLPRLASVGGLTIAVRSPGFAAPALTRVAGHLVIEGDIERVEIGALGTVSGDLVLNSGSLRDLDGLAGLTRIAGSLQVMRGEALTSIELPLLHELDGGLEVVTSYSLLALTRVSLPAMGWLLGAVEIAGAPALTRIAIPGLEVDRVTLRNLPALRSLDLAGRIGRGGLELSYAGIVELAPTGLRVQGPVTVASNPGLRRLALVLAPAQATDSATRISGNPVLDQLSLTGLAAAELRIDGSPRLASLALPGFGGSLDLSGGAFTDLGFLAGVTGARAISMSALDHLTSAAGAADLTSVGTLSIRGCHALTSLAGLPTGLLILDRLAVVHNDAVTDLSALAGLEFRVHDDDNDGRPDGASIQIGGNASLTSLRGLDGIGVVGGGLSLEENPALVDLRALAQLTEIGGHLVVSDSDSLVDLTGLAALRQVHGEVLISDNPRLATVDGVEALRTIGDSLSIHDNPALGDLDGLGALVAVGARVFIRSNPALADDAIDALLARLGRPPAP